MERTRNAPGAALEIALVALVVVAIKLAWMLADPTLRIFLGDSAAYLHSALVGIAPPDRSFVYPLLLRWFALPAATLEPVLLGQSLLGALTALLVFSMLRELLGVRFALAALAAALLATEPAQVALERMVMAESAGTYCLTAAIAAGLAYVRTRSWRFLVYGIVAGLGAAMLRMSLLPVVLGMVLLPACVVLAEALLRRNRRALAHGAVGVAVALSASALVHGGYQRWYDLRTEAVDWPAYTAREGAMRLALVAPLVRPAHLERQGLSPRLLEDVGPRLADPRTREAQMWFDDGIVAVVTRAVGTPRDSERIMRKIAVRAAREDPLGFIAMSRFVAGGYFDDATVAHRIADDLGARGPNPGQLRWLRDEFGYEGARIAGRPSAATRWFSNARWWFTACLFALPLFALAAAWVHWRRDAAAGVYLVALTAGMLLSHVLFSAIVCFRYLHAHPVVMLVVLAWLAEGLLRRHGCPDREAAR
ncbi:MAG TPA: glycosyltransferase family 39 protein [Candidatus Saccharimonadia bacterium]|nr:glycosyltransferase family 39 protein [Candidatus Saccharimonadia bacterium]